jgi:hypothetical protein
MPEALFIPKKDKGSPSITGSLPPWPWNPANPPQSMAAFTVPQEQHAQYNLSGEQSLSASDVACPQLMQIYMESLT